MADTFLLPSWQDAEKQSFTNLYVARKILKLYDVLFYCVVVFKVQKAFMHFGIKTSTYKYTVCSLVPHLQERFLCEGEVLPARLGRSEPHRVL